MRFDKVLLLMAGSIRGLFWGVRLMQSEGWRRENNLHPEYRRRNGKNRENISLAEAPGYGQTIFAYAPKSYGAGDFLALAVEIVAREQPPPPASGRKRRKA